MKRILLAALATAAAAIASPALARSHCLAPFDVFQGGQGFEGQVRSIVSGDTICVGSNVNPETWIEVKLADLTTPKPNEPGGQTLKDMMAALTKGQYVRCAAVALSRKEQRSRDHVLGVCMIGDHSVGDLMRQANTAGSAPPHPASQPDTPQQPR